MGKKLLIVAMTKAEIAEVESYLRERGCHVDVVTGRAEALGLLHAVGYDVVVLDLDLLPDLRPQDVLSAQPVTLHAGRIVVVTSKERPFALCQAAACGAASYMTKPLDKEWLYRHVTKA